MLKSWDTRRDLYVGGNAQEAIAFAVEHFVHAAQRSILQRGRFAVALSGGSTPKVVYQQLIEQPLEWSKIWLFWSDERAVPPDHPDSNYRMAMEFFKKVPIPASQVFRMQAESDIEQGALDYEEKVKHVLGKSLFDLVLLGVGEDGHTASLFPHTKALLEEDRLVVANHVPDKKCWRMTLTFSCINQSHHSAFYALGKSKKLIIPKVLTAPIDSEFPASRIGTPEHKALWILDEDAAELL